MKDILMIAHFTQVPGEQGNSRFPYLAQMLSNETNHVEMVTSSFSHRTKSQRIVSKDGLNLLNYKLTMLYEPNYEKNVSLKRFYSHYYFSKSLRKYLKHRNKPDIIYCAVPSIDVAHEATKYAKKNSIPFIIDIQDLWPEAFKMIFNPPLLNRILYYPMTNKVNRVYRKADEIIAVSKTYVNRALLVGNKNNGISTYLGTDLDYFDSLINNNIDKPFNEFWIGYIGTLGHSYDIPTVFKALQYLNEKGYKNIKFIVMGDGPLYSEFKELATKKNIHARFTGRISYPEMVNLLYMCDIAVNPIRKGTAASIINKVGDYAGAGLPVINTQESKEYMDLLNTYNAGLNCENGNYIDMAKKVLLLYENKTLKEELGRNNRKLAEDKFNRQITYREIEKVVNNVTVRIKN